MAPVEQPAMMRALRAHERGSTELILETIPRPKPGTGDVLVRVHAASFTPTDLGWASTWVTRTDTDRAPIVPGHEVSGTVHEMGFGATGFRIGDAVCGLAGGGRGGARAEY